MLFRPSEQPNRRTVIRVALLLEPETDAAGILDDPPQQRRLLLEQAQVLAVPSFRVEEPGDEAAFVFGGLDLAMEQVVEPGQARQRTCLDLEHRRPLLRRSQEGTDMHLHAEPT